ncbi:GNAT family N-acetyltransferase [Sporolactobacillus kofuensis]|uniref:GNAT family N-acetyltransferase n=1 Tax=Sporolactobacillus kofuensis TaxID=269672 RepID=A0ABW1WED5_9BACL|nr:GNAT family N-acetyltransferase [Sporolactobacillus kofuensis]MCO7176204.1 GNAT family N-acetyltransferase [Sporolactobacillus kofuensis]
MIIKAVHSLNAEVKQEIRALENECAQADGCLYLTDLDDSINRHKTMNHTFLCYEKHRLIAFLHLFAPTSSEAELSAFTLPEYRRNGYFSALLLRTLEELNDYHIPDLLFVSQPKYPENRIIRHYGAIHDFSEYVMSLELKNDTKQHQSKSGLEIKEQRIDDLQQLIDVNVSAFEDGREEAQHLIEMTLLSSNRQGYSATMNGEIIGVCNVRFDGIEAFLFGLGIHKDWQGKGVGFSFLGMILEQLLSSHAKIVKLEVESRNEAAFHLYQKFGFTPNETINYDRVHVKDLKEFINE